MRQRWAALAAVAALVTATLVAAASPAVAANTETFLDGVAGVGDVAAGDGRVFVAALDRVVVADAAGAVTGAITGLPGAMGLALSADGGRLYVALSDTAEVAEVDTATLEITRRVSIAPNDCPTHLSLAGDRLWVGYGCYGQWSGGVDTFDVSAASPTVTSVVGSSYGAPVVAASGSVLVAGSTGLSPASFEVYGVDGASATLRGTITGDVSNLGDLAVTPDGATVVAAYGYRS